MSSDLNVHLWFGEKEQFKMVDVFEGTLACTVPPKNKDIDGLVPNRFGRLRVREIDHSEVIVDKSLNSNFVSDVINELKPFQDLKYQYEVSSAFDCRLYDEEFDSLDESLHPLTINCYGPEYGWNGLNFKSYGAIRIDFSNTRVFQVPYSLIEICQRKARRGEDVTKWLQFIAAISHNIDVVETLVRKLILKLNPVHLIVCTDSEVHPLTSHSIYHRDLSNYLEDLKKIAILHEYGGVYFHNVASNEPSFKDARKLLPYGYGILRGDFGNQTKNELVRKLQPFVDRLLIGPHQPNLSDSQIRDCFERLPSEISETMHNSYYVSVAHPPLEYLEELYFKLFDSVFQK